MGRKPIDRESLRQRVLDAAEKSIRIRGLVRSSMTELVKASGVSRRTFYKVFRSKEDVVKGIVDRKIEVTIGKAMDIIGREVTTTDKIESILRVVQGVLSFITPELMRDMATVHPQLWEYINERRLRALQIWREIIVEGQSRGEIRTDVDPEIFMQMLTTIAQHMVNPHFMTEHGLTPSKMIEQVRIILIYGLVPREGAQATREVVR